MSHVVKGKMSVLDLGVLRDSVIMIGLEFKQDQKTFRSYYPGEKCLHAIAVPNNRQAYEIGVRLDPETNNQGYALHYDPMCGGYGLEDVAGRGLERLKQEYTAQVATRQWANEGLEMTRHVDADGRIHLQAIAR